MATLESLSREIAAVRTELQQLATRMSAQDASRQRTELDQLRRALEACASAVPKTATTAVDAASSAVSDPPPAPAPRCYLDLLPARATKLTIRKLSEHSRSDSWRLYLSSEDLITIFTLGGPLANALCEESSSLELHLGNVTRPADNESDWPGISMQRDDAELALRASAGRTTALRFVIGAPSSGVAPPAQMPPPPPLPGVPPIVAADAVDWLHALRLGGNNVLHLDLVMLHAHTIQPLLQECGERLQSLGLDKFCSSRTHLRHVAAYCKRLRNFSLDCTHEHGDDLWAAIGPGLEKLELQASKLIYFPALAPAGPFIGSVLTAARAYCNRLTHFTCEKAARGKEMSSFLISCGARLQFARVSLTRLQETVISTIAIACPSAVFELIGHATVCAMRGLRYRISAIEIIHSLRLNSPPPPMFMPPRPMPNPFSLIMHLTMLRSIELRRPIETAAGILETIITLARPPLENISVLSASEPAFGILESMRGGVPLLRSLTLEAAEIPFLRMHDFVDDHPLLERLHFRPAESFDVIGELAPLMLSCQRLNNLKELCIAAPAKSTLPRSHLYGSLLTSRMVAETRNICMPLRNRGVAVSISNVDYLL